MSLSEIKTIIEHLTEKECCELSACLQNHPSNDWDLQMESDARAGRFDAMVREATEAYRKGECRPFP